MKKNYNFNLLFIFIFSLSFSAQAQSYWEDNFSASNFKDNYDMNAGQNFKHIANGGPNGDGCVEITVVKNTHLGGSMRYLLKEKLGFEPEELYAEYSVNYNADMKEYGGKAPGFSGTYDRAGWGNDPGYGRAGWSARGTVNADKQPYVKNVWYVYHSYTNYDAPNCPGSTDYRNCNPFPYDVTNPSAQPHASTKTWGSGLKWGNKGDMQFNTWYNVKQYIKLNTVGQNNGILRVWINGELANEFTNINFRRTNDLKIFAYWFNYYNGGPNTIKETGHVRIDNFKLYGPNGPSCSPGSACNDNDPCTINDVLDTNCNCNGTPSQDSDDDGVCDTIDQCPNLDDALIGTPCDDNNECTFNDIYTTNCNCEGTFQNSIIVKTIEDAYIQSGNGINNGILRLEKNDSRVSYLKYDLSTINETITDTKLLITNVTDPGNGKINVYLSNNTNWSENNLNTANAPNSSTLIGSIDGSYSENNTYTIHLSNLPNNVPFTLILKQQNGNDVAFASNDNVSEPKKPVLKIDIKSDDCQLSTISSVLNSLIRAYPNPLNNTLTIKNDSELELSISLFDTMGKKLITTIAKENTTHLNVSKLSSGIYLLFIKDKKTNSNVFKKLIKK